jgi:CrcB protein
MRKYSPWLAVAVGGGLGGATRALLDFSALTGGEPNLWTVLLVNLVGAGLLGTLVGHGTPTWSEPLTVGVTTGFLGSFTTFSAIMAAWLGLTLIPDPVLGVVYIVATIVAAVLSAYGGLEAGKWWRDMIAAEVTR